MIRTNVVNLTSIPAVAYRRKLTAGGSGIVILRGDAAQPGIASISKTSGDAIPTVNTPEKDYPKEAFAEAISLTAGMPYRKLGVVKYIDMKPTEVADEDENEEIQPETVIVDSEEYQAVVAKYTDKNDKLSYDLINRDMIKFAKESSVVKKMAEDKMSLEEIRRYVVGMKFRDLTGNRDLTDEQVQKMVDMLDEVSVKGVLKEFNEEIKKILAEGKRK